MVNPDEMDKLLETQNLPRQNYTHTKIENLNRSLTLSRPSHNLVSPKKIPGPDGLR